ncbi:MAG TPA: SRPBCC domain-containing protein, partial [Daejeonella sp.]
QYVHLCEVIEVDAPNKLSHTWTYENNSGHSIVTWELFKETEATTKVRLTHQGVETFANGDPNFEVASFSRGWNSILGESLKNYVEN